VPLIRLTSGDVTGCSCCIISGFTPVFLLTVAALPLRNHQSLRRLYFRFSLSFPDVEKC